MKREGNMCKWYLNLEGICFLNGSLCCNPFSDEGCDIQCRDVFHCDPITHKHYEPSEEDEKLTRNRVFAILRIKDGDMIAEWIIPYKAMNACKADPGVMIQHAIGQVKGKFNRENIRFDLIRVFHNVELLKGEYGVYVIGVSRLY